jgi:hypothetical protein
VGRKLLVLFLTLTSFQLLASGNGRVGRYELTITNKTTGQVFSPIVIALHSPAVSLFKVGDKASAGIVSMAEDGHTKKLIDKLTADKSNVELVLSNNTMVMPAKDDSIFFETHAGSKVKLSLVSMLASTNDTFFALESVSLPKRGEKSYSVVVYDAGSETNSESCTTIPGAPCDSMDIRDTSRAEGMISISTGIKGTGDLDKSKYGWIGTVAEITIKKI